MNFPTIRQEVEARRDRLTGLLRDLIRIDTSVPPGDGYEHFVDFVEPVFTGIGLKTERVVVPEATWKKIGQPLKGKRVNLVATMENGKPPLSIYAHMDVVPAGTGWTVPAFEGVIEKDRVIGRGAIDMKGTIPPVIVALEVMKDLGIEPRFDPRVLLCTDEEVGIEPGVKYLAENGYVKAPILHLEGGGQAPLMAAANTGSLMVTITFTGRPIHVGLGFLGINALEGSVPVMEELMKIKTEIEKRRSNYPSYPLRGMPSDRLTPTFNMTVMRAGEKLNIVPGRAVIEADRRWLPEEDLGVVKREITEAVDRGRARSKASVDLEIEVIYQTHEIDTGSEHVRRWCECVREVLGISPEVDFLFPGSAGATDMSYVGRELGTMDFIGAGLMDPQHTGAHQADESVPIANMVHLCEEIICFLAAG